MPKIEIWTTFPEGLRHANILVAGQHQDLDQRETKSRGQLHAAWPIVHFRETKSRAIADKRSIGGDARRKHQ